MDKDDRGECALWVWRYGSLGPELHDSEWQPAAAVMACEDEGEGSVAGVQFSDGTYVDCDDWPMLKRAREAQRRRWEEENADAANRPRIATRKVDPPFPSRGKVTIPADFPEWVGRPTS